MLPFLGILLKKLEKDAIELKGFSWKHDAKIFKK